MEKAPASSARGRHRAAFVRRGTDLAHAAELANGLRTHTNMRYHRNLRTTNSSNGFGLDRSTFELDRIGTYFFHDAAGVFNGLLRTDLVRHERHVHDHQSSLHSASDQFAVIDHLIEGHGERG